MAQGNLTLRLDKADYKHIKSVLDKMEKVDKNKVVSKSLRKGIVPVYKEERANVKQHVKTGNLLRALTTMLKTSKERIYTGFRRGGKSDRHKGYHSAILELGTVDRYTKSGHYTGSVQAKRPRQGFYLARRAYQKEGDKSLKITLNELKKWISQLWH